MSYNGAGTFNINSTGQPVATGGVISSTVHNALTADLATGLTNAICKDGQTTITANIPFNSKKITGLGDATALTDAASLKTVMDGVGVYVTSANVGGTANAITLNAVPAITAYTAGQTFRFPVASINTSTVTVNVSALGAKALTKNGTAPLTYGDLAAGSIVQITYDGTQFVMLSDRLVFNVQTFGASPAFSSATNTTAIQAAFTAAMAVGGTVAFPEVGPWDCGRITVNAACAVKGPATINMTATHATAAYWIEFTGSFTGFKAEDITVIGTGVEADSQYAFGPTSSSIVVTDAVFHHCTLQDVIVGIDATAMDNCQVRGGRIGPTLGNASGRGYGVAFGVNSKNCKSIGVHYYRTSRHGLYMGSCPGGVSQGDVFEEHGYGATPGLYSALVLGRSKGQSAVGPIFRNCVHNTAEITDDSGVSGTASGCSLFGGASYNSPRGMTVGENSATVSANASTECVIIANHAFDLPTGTTEAIRVYQANGLLITGNQFMFKSDTVAQNCVTIDDVAANYPTNVKISGNLAYLNTTDPNKAIVYFDTAVCGSGSTAAIHVSNNSLFGSGQDINYATAIQNANIITDTLMELGITGATPYVSGFNRFAITQAGATNVTNFLGGYTGKRISIRIGDANSTLTNAMYLAGAVNFAADTHDQIVLEYDGSNWREISRSVN